MLLPLVLPYLSIAHEISVTRIIHTKTQDGKSVLDAHFAKAMHVLVTWVIEGNNCITSTQAVIGLKCHGGLPNSVVELIEHNRQALEQLIKQVEGMEKQLRKFTSRANEIKILLPSPTQTSGWDGGYNCCPDLSLKVFEYSGIGAGILISCSPSRSLCTVVSPVEVGGPESVDLESMTEDIAADSSGLGLIVTMDNGDEIRRQMDIEAGSEDVESIGEEGAIETIDVDVTTSVVSGVRVATQGQMRRRTRRWRKQPESHSSSPSSVRLNDAVAYAVRATLEMKNAGKLFVQDPSSNYGVYNANVLSQFEVPHSFPAGWATQPKRGRMYGQKYVADFREDIRTLFEVGEHDISRKWSQDACWRHFVRNIQGVSTCRLKTRFDKIYRSSSSLQSQNHHLHRKTSLAHVDLTCLKPHSLPTC